LKGEGTQLGKVTNPNPATKKKNQEAGEAWEWGVWKWLVKNPLRRRRVQGGDREGSLRRDLCNIAGIIDGN